MDSGGPYLNAALLCEKILQERDGVLSVIRAIDRITVTVLSPGTLPETLPPSLIQFQLLIVLKSGIYKGSAPVKIAIQAPSGAVVGESTTDVFFEGDDRGANLISPTQLQVSEEGLYWIEVSCREILLTRIPLRIVYQRISQGSLAWPQNR